MPPEHRLLASASSPVSSGGPSRIRSVWLCPTMIRAVYGMPLRVRWAKRLKHYQRTRGPESFSVMRWPMKGAYSPS